MKFQIILSALVTLCALPSVAFADLTNSVPNSVSGGSGTVSAIQADDGISYGAPKGSTINIGGFTAVGGDISSVVLHVRFSVDSGGYTGTNPIHVNGVSTAIIPTSGDTERTASIAITAGNFRVNTWPEITALAVTFANNDGGSGQSVQFDHAYLVITHSTPLFAPPTWSDEFDDSGPPNPAVWTFEQGFVRNSELQWYQSNNAWQQNGSLIIEGRREQVPNPNYVAGSSDWRTNRQFAQYTSSSIISQGKYSFKYGRIQVRAKIPCFPGSWPAIWTIGNTGEWPSCGEIDILEYYATDSVLANIAKGSSSRWSATWYGQKTAVSPFLTAANPNWRTEHHVWTMQWDEQTIRLYLDNHLMKSVPQTSLVNPVTTWGPKEPFKQPHFLLLNLALGGAGGSPANTTFPLRYELDYVRVWEGLTGNNSPTDIALASNTVPPGLPRGTVVGSLSAADVDAAEVHNFSLVSGTGSTHNSSFEVVFRSDQPKNSILRTAAVLNSADGATRSIRVRVTDIEGATYDKVLTVQLQGQFVVEVAPGSLAVPEGGTNTFDVRLRVAPTQPITVGVSRLDGDTDLSVTSPSQLTFTPANGTVWQTVTLAAAEDADRTNGTATILCNDASGAFLSATVTANEADNEDPPIQAVVVISNLNQTFDGYMKTVNVTTTPAGLSHELTYEGQFMPPTDAGSYDVVATINDPDYTGSASGIMVVAKASQTINFAPLGPVPDNTAPFALTATASSGLPVSYASSNTSLATVSGNTLTIVGPGTTTITAAQPGDANRDAAASVPQTLTVSRADPLAVANGPYLVLFNQLLSLHGGGSQPSDGQTITSYSWDLNNDGTFGDVTGATPSVSFANLTTTWAMVDGFNTIALRVTDSAGKISTVSTTVEVVVNLTWDSNGAAALQTDGAGDWTTASQWWNGSSNTNWTSGDDAIFGNSGTGGAVTLASPTTVNSLTFNSFTGTYTLGTSGQTITLNNGITQNAGSSAVTIVSPVTLGAAQSWTNDSAGLLSIGPDAVSNGGFLLSVGGTGNTTVSGTIGGAGGLTKSGAGTLSLSGSNGYSGTTTVSGGTLILSNANTNSAATSVAATGTLQLSHANAMGNSTMTLASGATLQLRNDSNTTFTAPIATPAGAVTYHFDVNNAGSAVTGKTLSLGNITFSTNTNNVINVTGENSYTLGLGTLSLPTGVGGKTFTVNATTAAVTISNFSAGSYGVALGLQGGNAVTLNTFELGSNGSNTLTVSGSGTIATLGSTAATNGRSSGSAAFTLTSGTLNLTTTKSLANVNVSGTAGSPTFTINSGTLNNTSGSALTLAANNGITAGSPTITIGGNFAFGTAGSTNLNNLNLGTGAITNAGNRTIALNGTSTTLTLGGTMTNGVAGNQTTTVNGPGNTLSLGGYNLSNTTTSRIDVINGTGNVDITGVVANGSGSTASGLTYSGSGTLTLGGLNTFSGNTTVNSGTLEITSTGKLYSVSTSVLTTVNSGATLQVYAWQYGLTGSIGNPYFGPSTLIVNGGTITYTGVGENSGNNNGRVFAIGTGGASLNAAGSGTWFLTRNAGTPLDQTTINGLTLTGSGNGQYSNVLAGTGGSLTKSGNGTWTLAGANTYTGTTAITGGTLVITGTTQATSAITFSGGGVLGLDIATPVTAASATVDFTGQSVLVTGTPTLASYTLLTALLIPGTAPTLASPVPGYALQVVSNQLRLVQTGGGSPEIDVNQGGDIATGGSKGFGTVTQGLNTSLVFTINNTGTADLNLTGTQPDYVTVSGANAGDFTVTSQPTTPVTSGGGTTNFTVQFTPGGAGARNALLTILSNDSDEGTFTINVSGTGQTKYQAWAVGALFEDDANNDGVDNGLAFLLGAGSPTTAVTLPTVTQSGGNLILDFNCLPVAARGGATLRVEHSSDLGVLDPWTATTGVVPDATNAVPDNNVTFVVGAGPVGPPALNSVTATIDSAAAADNKLFARLKAAE